MARAPLPQPWQPPPPALQSAQLALPPTVNWHLEPRCNYHCKFCFATFSDIPSSEVVKDADLLLAVSTAVLGRHSSCACTAVAEVLAVCMASSRACKREACHQRKHRAETLRAADPRLQHPPFLTPRQPR